MSADARLDTRAHVTAIRAALTATLGPGVVFEWGQVPGEDDNGGSLPTSWVLVSVQRREIAATLLSAEAGMTSWRVNLGATGAHPDETRWALYKIATALNEESLTIGGATTSPLQFDNERATARDENRYYAAVTYTYAL